MRRSVALPWLVLAMAVFMPLPASAEWQVKPFFGATFGGSTTFVDPDHAAGTANLSIGVSAVWLGEVIGLDAEVGRLPGYFQRGKRPESLVLRSNVTTLTGNMVFALPRSVARYSLRPYFVGGAGLMRVRLDPLAGGALQVASTLPGVDFGGGVTGFLSNRVGLSWEGRWFRTTSGKTEGVSVAPEQLSFWRASMALAIKL